MLRKKRESDVGYFAKREKEVFCFGTESLSFLLHFSFTTWLGCMDASRAGSKFLFATVPLHF